MKWTEITRKHFNSEYIITEELRPLVGGGIKHVLRDVIVSGDGTIKDIKYMMLD